jgi:hypothetical protein
VTGILTLIATFFLASAFKNISFKGKVKRTLPHGLTSKSKKPKLTRKL